MIGRFSDWPVVAGTMSSWLRQNADRHVTERQLRAPHLKLGRHKKELLSESRRLPRASPRNQPTRPALGERDKYHLWGNQGTAGLGDGGIILVKP